MRRRRATALTVNTAIAIRGYMMTCRILHILALALLAAPVHAQESQLDVVLKRDKLIVGTYTTSPPLAFVDDKGDLVGFEIDMAHEIAKDLLGDPNKIEFVVVQSDGRLPAVLSGKIDFGMCSTTISPDRAARVAFTYPYIDCGSVVLARKDAGITKIQELERSQIYLRDPECAAGDRARQAGTAECHATAAGQPFGTAFWRSRPAGRRHSRSTSRSPTTMRGKTTTWRGWTPRGRRSIWLTMTRSILKPGDFKWWLYLDTYVRELRFGTRYEQYTSWYRTWLHKEPPPQRPYDTDAH